MGQPALHPFEIQEGTHRISLDANKECLPLVHFMAVDPYKICVCGQEIHLEAGSSLLLSPFAPHHAVAGQNGARRIHFFWETKNHRAAREDQDSKQVQGFLKEGCSHAGHTPPSGAELLAMELKDALLNRCPTCRVAFSNFDNCCAIACICGSYFCAWCLEECEDDGAAHYHVPNCKLNPSPGTVDTSPEVWE